mmetsp:Transcript_33380/g.98416  ORF Transcript_33380/g.98416 Transcript_33380/m.98416 type:complete len:224 (-) Transcript_33380:530-1201(-)
MSPKDPVTSCSKTPKSRVQRVLLRNRRSLKSPSTCVSSEQMSDRKFGTNRKSDKENESTSIKSDSSRSKVNSIERWLKSDAMSEYVHPSKSFRDGKLLRWAIKSSFSMPRVPLKSKHSNRGKFPRSAMDPSTHPQCLNSRCVKVSCTNSRHESSPTIPSFSLASPLTINLRNRGVPDTMPRRCRGPSPDTGNRRVLVLQVSVPGICARSNRNSCPLASFEQRA